MLLLNAHNSSTLTLWTPSRGSGSGSPTGNVGGGNDTDDDYMPPKQAAKRKKESKKGAAAVAAAAAASAPAKTGSKKATAKSNVELPLKVKIPAKRVEGVSFKETVGLKRGKGRAKGSPSKLKPGGKEVVERQSKSKSKSKSKESGTALVVETSEAAFVAKEGVAAAAAVEDARALELTAAADAEAQLAELDGREERKGRRGGKGNGNFKEKGKGKGNGKRKMPTVAESSDNDVDGKEPRNGVSAPADSQMKPPLRQTKRQKHISQQKQEKEQKEQQKLFQPAVESSLLPPLSSTPPPNQDVHGSSKENGPPWLPEVGDCYWYVSTTLPVWPIVIIRTAHETSITSAPTTMSAAAADTIPLSTQVVTVEFTYIGNGNEDCVSLLPAMLAKQMIKFISPACQRFREQGGMSDDAEAFQLALYDALEMNGMTFPELLAKEREFASSSSNGDATTCSGNPPPEKAKATAKANTKAVLELEVDAKMEMEKTAKAKEEDKLKKRKASSATRETHLKDEKAAAKKNGTIIEAFAKGQSKLAKVEPPLAAAAAAAGNKTDGAGAISAIRSIALVNNVASDGVSNPGTPSSDYSSMTHPLRFSSGEGGDADNGDAADDEDLLPLPPSPTPPFGGEDDNDEEPDPPPNFGGPRSPKKTRTRPVKMPPSSFETTAADQPTPSAYGQPQKKRKMASKTVTANAARQAMAVRTVSAPFQKPSAAGASGAGTLVPTKARGTTLGTRKGHKPINTFFSPLNPNTSKPASGGST